VVKKASPTRKAEFIDTMDCLPLTKVPEGPEWTYELKLDGYCALGIKTTGQVQLRSRNDNDFSLRYPGVVKALASLPDDMGHRRRGGRGR